MNPFEKLKLTIDRVGLQYIPSSDYPSIEGQTVYKYTKKSDLQQNYDAPYFKTQGPNQTTFKQRSNVFMQQQIQELKSVYENQQKNLIQEINLLNKKLEFMQSSFQNQQRENVSIKEQLISQQNQNNQLRLYINEIQQRNANKLSQSGVMDRQRKLKQQIDRINMTLNQLAKDWNSQKMNKKNLQKQLENTKNILKESEKQFLEQKKKYEQIILQLRQQLQKRANLLQHSIKMSSDDKIIHKKQVSQLKQKHQIKIQQLNSQIYKARQQIFNLKRTILQLNNQVQNLNKEYSNVQNNYSKSNIQLQSTIQKLNEYASQSKSFKQKCQAYKVQIAYLKQQLQDQRSNTKVKVVEVRDQSLQMELQMYKKQCKQLLKQKTIWESVGKQKNQYTIISQNQILLNSRHV